MLIKGDWKTGAVFVDGGYLSPRASQKAWNHSPDGFSWGFGGSGPAQLALGLLLVVTDEKTAVSLHQAFKWDVIAKIPQSDFEMELDVVGWIQDQMNFEIQRYGNFMKADQKGI